MWNNWAGNQTSRVVPDRPVTLDDLRHSLSGLGGTVRAAGAGHSFTPLIADSKAILDLSGLEGPLIVEAGEGRARVKATARLHELSAALAGHGLAFRNLGDINVQSLAGAMATATHGTGESLPCIAAEMTGARLMTASGEIVDIADEDIPGARVALGLLGVMLEIELNVVPAYDLRRRVKVVPVEEVIAEMGALWSAHRHFEFFWLPWSGKAIRVMHDISDQPRGKAPMDLDNIGVKAMALARNVGRISPGLRRLLMSLLLALQSDEDFTGESWRVLSKPREVKFVEMEYHLPPKAAGEVLRQIMELAEEYHPDVYFPVEVRKSAGDDGWLSPFQGGSRVSIAIHGAAKEDARGYFADAEAVFRAAGGRPHWGKMHSLVRKDLEALYPDLPKFDALRERLDPEGRFMTPAMARLLRP